MGLQQREAEPLHPGPALETVDQRPALRLVEREVTEDREPVGMLTRGLDRERVGVGIPPGRMDDGRVDAALVHFLQHVGGREIGHLTMVRIRRLVVPPDVDLRVDDRHDGLLSLGRVSLAEIPFVFKRAATASAVAAPLRGEPLRR